MPEISEDDLKVLKGSKVLLDKLLQGKTRRPAEKLIKEVYPETVTTDDLVDPYVSEIKEVRKELSDFIKAQQGEKLDSRLNRDISHLKSERDYTDEGIEKLKKMMVEKEIPDIIVAADHFERQHPPKQQEPSLISPTDWGFGRKTEDADLNLLFNDEDAWAEKEATKVWNEEARKRGQIIT
jgi:hypothetical protein